MTITLYTPAGDPVEAPAEFAGMAKFNPPPSAAPPPAFATSVEMEANKDRMGEILAAYWRKLGFTRGEAKDASAHLDYWASRALSQRARGAGDV